MTAQFRPIRDVQSVVAGDCIAKRCEQGHYHYCIVEFTDEDTETINVIVSTRDVGVVRDVVGVDEDLYLVEGPQLPNSPSEKKITYQRAMQKLGPGITFGVGVACDVFVSMLLDTKLPGVGGVVGKVICAACKAINNKIKTKKTGRY